MEVILSLIFVVVCVIFIYKLYRKNNKLENEIIQLEADFDLFKRRSRDNTRNAIRGQITEEITPLFTNFPYTLSDCKFMGSPIDYIIFDGMSKLRDTGEGEITIILADVKVNTARLSKIQKAIKDALENNRIKFDEFKIKDNNLSIK